MSQDTSTTTVSDVHVGYESFEQPQADYFGFASTERFLLPDRVSFIEFRIMNEGKKAQFQKMTSRDLVLERSGNARTKMDPAQERHELIRQSVIGWNLKRKRSADGPLEDVPFNNAQLGVFLQDANPKIIEDLEAAIRKANPWLMSELTVEQIDEQMNELRDLREQAVERERGEGSSASK